jgi:hypothetical protein
VGERRAFLLRIDPEVLQALERWARDDLRSLNGQIEFVLRRVLREAGRLPGGAIGAPAAEPPKPGRRR